ncbi:MAG TPA: type II toxin-antitoxin system VapC family toxin [Candidatus Limnocylindria bacterium]
MADLLLDTDVLIDVLRGARRLAVTGHRVAYSVVTKAELFSGRAKDEEAVRVLLSPFRELDVDGTIAEHAGRLARVRVDMSDALIAATALEHRLELVTRNARDFKGIAGLQVRDPSTM